MQSTLNRLARTAARRPARARRTPGTDLSLFHEASADELQGLASIAGSSSRDSLGSSSRDSLATAPPTPAEALRPFSSSPAASSPAATCGAVGSASAGQGSTAALQADAVVRVLFPLLGPRFHAAVTRLLEGPWRAARKALADGATRELQARITNAASSDIAHHYCSTASAEVKDLMYALVSLAVDFQINAPQTPSSTDLLMFTRVKRAPKDSADACLAVYNIVHRVLMKLRLQCFHKPEAGKTDVHQQGHGSMSHLLQAALIQRAAALRKPATLSLEDALVMSVIQNMKGGGGQPVWGTKGKAKGAIDPFLRGLLDQLSEEGREVSINLVQGARMVPINYASNLGSANLTDAEVVLLTLLQQDGPDLSVGLLRSPACGLVLPREDAESIGQARKVEKKKVS